MCPGIDFFSDQCINSKPGLKKSINLPNNPCLLAMTPAIDLLRKEKIAHAVHEYTHESGAESYGLEAAEKLDIDPDWVFKTLVVQLEPKLLAVALLPVSNQLALKAMARVCKAKRAELADPLVVERTTGYVLGGVSPLGQKKPLMTVVDQSAEVQSSIYVSAGKRGLEIELAPSDLVRVLHASYAHLAS